MKKNAKSFSQQNKMTLLWAGVVVLALATAMTRTILEESPWVSYTSGVLLLCAIALLLKEYRHALKTRGAAQGLNSVFLVIVTVSFLGVLNWLSIRHPVKFDLTREKVHTLSAQTAKVMKGVKTPIVGTYFAKPQQRTSIKPLFDNYAAETTQFTVEYIDPDKEPTRTRTLGIRKLGTLHLAVGERSQKIEDVTEEKLTNAIIKLTKERQQTLCTLSGHGEHDFDYREAEGYQGIKQGLVNQSIVLEKIALTETGAVPAKCDAVVIAGPKKAFFEKELEILDTYLSQGGRALIALNLDVKRGSLSAPGIVKLLKKWFIHAEQALVVDPFSRLFGSDASVPVINEFSKDHPITKDFANTQARIYFPFSIPLRTGKQIPAGMNVVDLAKTNPKSWGETNLKELTSGRVRVGAEDIKGPITTAIALEGKLKGSKAERNTRLVVFGTSLFATNNYSRFGNNFDFFMNAASWTLEDESLISIRKKDKGNGQLELTPKLAKLIFWIVVIILPVLILGSGIVVWARRRRL